MIIINPYFQPEHPIDGEALLKAIERYGRTCYKTEGKIKEDSAEKFVKMIIDRGHESVLEHEKITIRVICDRGVTHEWVRHRIGSYSQESTRYCNYSKKKFRRQLTFIEPCFWKRDSKNYQIWKDSMRDAEATYLWLLDRGASPQEARSVLPNSLKTEIVVTFNLREWRHFFKLRTTKAAHPQMREITIPLLTYFKTYIPVVFDDIEAEE